MEGAVSKTLYAAFGEEGDIWLTTIRYSEAEVVESIRHEPSVRDPDRVWECGVSLGRWQYDPFRPCPVIGVTPIEWLRGHRSITP